MMQSLSVSAILSVFLIIVVSGHIINNGNVHRNSNSDNNRSNNNNSDIIGFNNTEVDVDSNITDTVNATTTRSPVTEENRVFRLRERVHSRNRRYRIRRIREDILNRLGWTEPPRISETLRLQILNTTGAYHTIVEEPDYNEDRRCFSASCSLPRQISRALWQDESRGAFRVYTNMMSRHEVSSRSRLQSATLNVFLTHIEGYTCHGEEVPISQTGSRFMASVYQFMRPLRFQRSRNRILNKTRVIDVKMVTTSGNTWVTFDVTDTVSEWFSGARNNFGFEIIVRETENETQCNAMNMFVPTDCTSPEETGCREDTSEPARSIFPWAQESIDDNYPYLEIVTRQNRHNHRRRNRRDVTRTSSAGRNAVYSTLPVIHGNTVGICQGRDVRVNLRDSHGFDHVIAPSYYTTLECEGTCATALNGNLQVVASPCRATEQRQIMGLYFDDSPKHNIIFGPLPFIQVLQCGC